MQGNQQQANVWPSPLAPQAPEDRPAVAVLRLFAAARVAAGTGTLPVSGHTVGDVLATTREKFGPEWSRILEGSRVWVNGEPADPGRALADGDEIAVLPPVSGGS